MIPRPGNAASTVRHGSIQHLSHGSPNRPSGRKPEYESRIDFLEFLEIINDVLRSCDGHSVIDRRCRLALRCFWQPIRRIVKWALIVAPKDKFVYFRPKGSQRCQWCSGHGWMNRGIFALKITSMLIGNDCFRSANWFQLYWSRDCNYFMLSTVDVTMAGDPVTYGFGFL